MSWPGIKWDIMPIGKYQLFLHNLNTKASILMVFVKNKTILTRHDSTFSMERIMFDYCIMKEISVNIGKIISEHILAWVKLPQETRFFLHLINKLRLKACLALEKLPQVKVEDGVWTPLTLHCIIRYSQNQSKDKTPQNPEKW